MVFSEFSQEKVLRRFDLSGKTDVGQVEVQLQDGILEIIAPKLPAKVVKREGTSGASRSEARERASTGKTKPSTKSRKKPSD